MLPHNPECDFQRRFGGIARLYGEPAFLRLQQAHVCIIGVGGVGSWVVEALARSAIGKLTLIDLDHVAESNINRQIQALNSTLGQAKVEALSQRIALINPFCKVQCIEDFVTPDNIATLLPTPRFDYVIDAIDDARAKAALIAYCKNQEQPIITIGSAGGKCNPTQILLRDLSKTEQDPLLSKVRRLLRAHYQFPRQDKTNKFFVDAVFSMEPILFPEKNQTCHKEKPDVGLSGLNCAGFGSSMAVTASFGLTAASHVLQHIAHKN
jgi:tRNA A37 threonylcarbamoyladenosine dehydratase